jgi:hypothetical protein
MTAKDGEDKFRHGLTLLHAVTQPEWVAVSGAQVADAHRDGVSATDNGQRYFSFTAWKRMASASTWPRDPEAFSCT